MKYTLVLTFCLVFSMSFSQNSYDSLWKEVEKLEIEGLPKSSLKIVEDIYINAKKENNATQIIKSLLFKTKFALVLDEDAQLKIIEEFLKEIEQSSFPTKNILESLLANLYWQYFQQNRYKFYKRTNLEEKDSHDFRTWDLETLFHEIHLHFQKSLKNGLMLQLEPLESYKILLNEKQDSKIYRPTLFDLLSHNALDFYKSSETEITKPAYKFEIDNPNFLGNAFTFSRLKITSKDSTSLQMNALKIYQNLLKFHLSDTSLYAYVDVDIERLNFINQHAILENKEDLLLETLKNEKERLSNNDASGIYNFEIANIYFKQSQEYRPKTEYEYRWKAKEAMAICDDVISQFPNSKGAEKCTILKEQILQKSLQIKTESYIPIQKHARLLVNYKNLEHLDFKIFELNPNQLKKLNEIYLKEEQLAFIKKLKESIIWNSTLRNENDYQSHSTEIILPKLENGRYLIFASYNDNSIFAFHTIQVTNIALAQEEDQQFKIFQVIDRNNGKPITNGKVELSYNKRNSNSLYTENLTTDANGEIKIEKDQEWYRNVNLKVNYGNDTAYFGNYYINNFYKPEEEKQEYKAFLFTDRSIYRPGQTVYFKGIAIKSKNNKTEVLSNEDINVTLYNTNLEEVKELELKTNEFGSVSGEFILPNDGLTGEYSIEIDGDDKNFYSEVYFSVEEYKRPKFETNFKPKTESYKVFDSITVQGNALAYSGSNITDAKVVYRVSRKVNYPRWYYWKRPSFYGESQEITHGETTTNEKGEFEIIFQALPDLSADKTNLPIFSYEISADVTDVNGETRSATTTMNVGYHSLIANLSVPSRLNKDEKNHELTIDTKNLNGEFTPSKGTIRIYKLKAPNNVLRNRPWPAPDYQEIPEETFKNLFPNEAYTNENDSNNWEKGSVFFESSFDTEISKAVKLGNIKKWPSGQYLITLESKDKFGQTVKDEIKTILYSEDDKTIADSELFSITQNKNNYKIGDQVQLTLASAAPNVFVTLTVEKQNKIVKTEIVQLNHNKKTIVIPVTSKDIGGFTVHYSFAAYNDYKSGMVSIAVPYPKSELDIEATTFRDKLEPGIEETWSFKIKGPQGEKVSAEILASMYDASLDQFNSHDWDFNPIQYLTFRSNNNRNAHQSFGTVQFTVQQSIKYIVYPQQFYDQFNWFGLNLNNNHWAYQNYLRTLRLKSESKYDNSIKEGIVTGLIYDENGLPLPGVNVLVKGTTRGTQTDFDGNFSIEAGKGEVLVISYLGYISIEHKMDKNNSLSISMSPDSSQLEEVVLTSYGVQTEKRALSASVTNVGYESMDDAELNELSIELTKVENNNNTSNFDDVQIRKNLQETAFFFPQLQTDAEGNVTFSFTSPEALTKWKLQLLAHTKNLNSQIKTLETVTQKELMVIPNVPRFLREGDNIVISTKIANLSDKALSGHAKLQLLDAITGEDISEILLTTQDQLRVTTQQDFIVDAKGNTQVSWVLTIPDIVQAVQYKIVAKAGDFSDGEQNAVPVLRNRMLVTETLPMWVRSNETRTFELDKLKTNNSTSLKNHKLTLEITSNPAWYAVQALPYLMEYPYECNEQTFSRYYANALASHIANSNPRIQEVFNQWKNSDALLSNLEKTQELKSLLIQETPWLLDAQSETEQQKRIGLLFDLNKMNSELNSSLRKLKNNQLSDGSWPWFNGGYSNRFITQHIITGFGHLKQLNVVPNNDEESMIQNAINYLDAEFVKEYKDLTKYSKDVDLNKDYLSYTQLHYLYMRSFFPEIKKSKEVEEITTYYLGQIKQYWLSRSLYAKGLMALISYRANDKITSEKILKSLKENSINNDELGMYWKENTASWYWHQAPIETQSLLIEAFSEIENDTHTIDNLKIWLLKNKQTNRWETTKATTNAVYALVLQGSDWLSVTDAVEVLVGNQKIEPSKLDDVKVEAGTGYYKTSWNGKEINPEMATVSMTKKGDGIAWGSLYWQYFEDLDKVTSADSPLKLKKKLFLKTNTDRGEQLTEVTENTSLKIGDLVRVRIELRSDRNMEFIHMKDMRASGLEPINVLSQYKWQDGLGYYESTKDAATNFFFDYLPKGVYVFEYDLRVNNAGNMSNGITTIQSMYAPEFSSHSEGVRLKVE